MVPKSKLARFGCRKLKDNADLTRVAALAQDEVSSCDLKGADFSVFLGLGTVDQQNAIISNNGGGGNTFVDSIFTASFCNGVFCGEVLSTLDASLELDFMYADVYLRSEVEVVNFGAAVEVPVTVHIQVADW